MQNYQVTSRLTCRTFYVKARSIKAAISKVVKKDGIPSHDNFYAFALKR